MGNGRHLGVKLEVMGKVGGDQRCPKCRIGRDRESVWMIGYAHVCNWMCPGVKLWMVVKLDE